MSTVGGEQAGDPQQPAEIVRDRGASSLDRLATWAVDTQAFVRKLGGEYRRWSGKPPNSPAERTTFERALRNLIDRASTLEGRLRDIGSDLPDLNQGYGGDGDDRAAAEVYGQLTTTGFLDAWRLMKRRLEHQALEALEPKTAAEWRTYFRRFDAVWKGAQDLGLAARAARGMLEELHLLPDPRRQGGKGMAQPNHQQMLLEEIGSICGELVALLVKEEILREDGQSPTPSHDIVKSHGTGGGSGTERVQPLTERLERYLDVVDRLIATLTESSFLRFEGNAEADVDRLRAEMRGLLACAQDRYTIANNVLHAVLQMADPVFVAPREAVVHATDAHNYLQDLAIRDRRLGRAVAQVSLAAASRSPGSRSWADLDEVERAILSHLRRHPQSTRQRIQAAIPRFSPATVWQRLKDLQADGIVDSHRGQRDHADRPGGSRTIRRPTTGSGREGKEAGGSAPFVFQLSRLGENLEPGVADK